MRIPRVSGFIDKVKKRISEEKELIQEYFRSPSRTRLFALFAVVALVLAIPVTVVFLNYQTNTQQHASGVGDGSGCTPGQPVTGSYCSGVNRYQAFYTTSTCNYAVHEIKANDPTCGYKAPPTPTPFVNTCTSHGNRCAPSGSSCATAFGVAYSEVSGTCDIYHRQVCCGLNPNLCSNTSGASCQKYQCANGQNVISGKICSQGGEFVCCKNTGVAPKYSCITGNNNNDPTGTTFTGTDGSVTQCGTGMLCKKGTTYSTNSGAAAAKSHICVSACAANNGTCYQNNSCGTGGHEISQSCAGTGRICCIPNSINVCASHGGSCEKYSCGTGQTQVSYSCPIQDSVCCTPIPPTAHTCSVKYNGTCRPNCKSGETNITDAAAVKDCSINSSGNPLCCAPPPSGGGTCTGSNCNGGGGSCTNGKTTKFAMNITLPGIGSGSFDNHSPKHASRHAAIYVKDGNGNAIFGTSSNFGNVLNHVNTNGPVRVGTFDLKTTLVCGKTYFVYVKVPGYLTIKQPLTYGSSTQSFDVTAIPGDIVSAGTNNTLSPDGNLVGDDQVTIADYSIVKACRNVDPNQLQTFTSGSTTIKAKCSDLINYFDYPDGGTKGDEWSFNYNLWLRGFIKANGY